MDLCWTHIIPLNSNSIQTNIKHPKHIRTTHLFQISITSDSYMLNSDIKHFSLNCCLTNRKTNSLYKLYNSDTKKISEHKFIQV